MAENPFRIGSHVTGAFFTDRAAEVSRIRNAMRQPARLLVFGPRRMGKSSAIAVAADGARRDGVLVVRADLSTASGFVDVANRLLRSLSTQRTREKLAELAAGLAPSVSLTFDTVTGAPRIVFGAERRGASGPQQRRSIEQVIESLARETVNGPVAVVLDEFQAVARLGGEEAEWHLRDLMQTHPDLTFVCAGSEVALIQEMLDQHQPFFRMFELLHLGPVEPGHLATWIESRMEAAGVAAEGTGASIVRSAGPRTQDILQVARHVYSQGLRDGRARAEDVEAAMRDVVREEDPVIRAIWTQLTAHQQNVLRAVASETEKIFSTPARERFGLPTSSTVATAVDALVSRGLLVRDLESGSIEFDSPFVRLWVVTEVLHDVPPHP